MVSADSGKSFPSTGDFPEKPHQPRSTKVPMRDTGKQKRAFNPKWFDQFTFLHYREDSDSVICHTCALADKGYTVIISDVFLLSCSIPNFKEILSLHILQEMKHSEGVAPIGGLVYMCQHVLWIVLRYFSSSLKNKVKITKKQRYRKRKVR